MKVQFLVGDDWCGMYVDGKLSAEGHSLQDTEIAERLVGKENVSSRYVAGEAQWDAWGYSCPEDFPYKELE